MPARAHVPEQPESPEPEAAPETAPEELEAEPARPVERSLADVEAERDQYLADLQRVAADFDNYRKRVAREKEALVARAHAALVEAVLPVVDDLERALEAASLHEEAKLEDGVRLVHRQLLDVLAKEGLEEIPTGGLFDPHVHEAMAAIPAEAEEGTILEVVQRGYMLGDRVLRPARVIVAGGRPEQQPVEQPEEG